MVALPPPTEWPFLTRVRALFFFSLVVDRDLNNEYRYS